MLSKNQECCYSYFKDMQDTFSQLDYSRMNVLCAIGSPYLPSCALFCADEVSCCAYKEGDQYAIALDGAHIQGKTSGNISFHVTVMLTVCVEGFRIPNFYILSDDIDLSKNNGSIFRGLDEETTVSTNLSGSMTKTTKFATGTFSDYCDHLIATCHSRSCLDRSVDKVIVYVDNHSSRFDLVSLCKLRNNNIILKTIPANSSDIYQLGDTVFENKKLQTKKGKNSLNFAS